MRRIVNLMQKALNNKSNIESMLMDIENVVNDLREYNYNNQCSSYIPCKYWRAEVCIFGDRCRFKHFKINNFPLDCPHGNKCRYKIDGKCNCVSNIRKKFYYRLCTQKPGIGNPIGNNINLKYNQARNNNKQVNPSQKIITNGINKTATTNVAKIKVLQFNGSKSDRLELSKSNNIVSDNQSDIKEEDKQINSENNNNNNNNNTNSNNINNNNNELKNDKDLPDISSELQLGSKDNGGNLGNRRSFNKNLNGMGIRTLNLQMTENGKLGSSGSISFNNKYNNTNNNNNNNNKQSNQQREQYSHIEKVKEKRMRVLGRHNSNVLCPSLHNKNNNNTHKNNNKNNNNNNNNNNEITMLNELLDYNLTPNSSFESSISGLSSLKENDGTIGNCDTYHKFSGIGIKSPNLQLTGNDYGGFGANLSLFTNMACIKNKHTNTELSKINDNSEKLGDSSDGSIVSTVSTDAVLHNSVDDDDDD